MAMIFSLFGATPQDMLPSLVKEILMWPTEVLADARAGNYLAIAEGLGASYYLLGMPSTDLPLTSLAQWYLLTGALVVGANKLVPGASSAAM
jgi:hypothetical protein